MCHSVSLYTEAVTYKINFDNITFHDTIKAEPEYMHVAIALATVTLKVLWCACLHIKSSLIVAAQTLKMHMHVSVCMHVCTNCYSSNMPSRLNIPYSTKVSPKENFCLFRPGALWAKNFSAN